MAREFRDYIDGRDGSGHLSRPVVVGILILAAILIALTLHMFVAQALGGELIVTHGDMSSSEVEPHGKSSKDSDATDGSNDEKGAESVVAVHVSGAVVTPGVYELPIGSRVNDVVSAAGGFTEDAQSDACNLARLLIDGEHVHIERIGEDSALNDNLSTENSASPSDNPLQAESLVNINTANSDILQSLPGIGPATAEKIIEERNANGPFSSIEDLTRVDGIGEKKLEALRDFACI